MTVPTFMRFAQEGRHCSSSVLGRKDHLDGKDAPISGKHPFGSDALAVTRVDANRRTIVEKKTGKTLFTATGTVSKDGKTLTQTFKGMNGEGQPISVTTVWDKQ